MIEVGGIISLFSIYNEFNNIAWGVKMKKIISKILSLLICSVLILGNFSSINAIEQGEKTEEGLIYKIEDNKAIIIGYDYYRVTDLVIPSHIEGYEVSEIADSAFKQSGFYSIKIPDTVKKIGRAAFYLSYAYKTIEIPDSVTYIGPRAFSQCYDLIEVKLSNSIKEIPESCFSFTTFESIEMPDSVEVIGDSAFRGNYSLKEIKLSKNLKTIKGHAFMENQFTTIELPQGLETIEDDAFIDCRKLEYINIPSSVERLKTWTFFNCYNLKEVKLNDGIKIIEKDVFYDCNNLEKINLPDSITSIGSDNFQETKIKSIVLPNQLKTISFRLFYNATELQSVVIPNSVKTISSKAFEGCKKLQEIKLPENLINISSCTFRNCTSLKEIDIPNTVNTIGSYAFDKCNNLENVKLSTNIKEISDYTFEGCTYLEEIDIPTSVTKLGEGAFKECSSLEKIVIPKSVEIIYNNTYNTPTFKNCNNLTIYGYRNTKAEAVALNDSINFVALEEPIQISKTTIGTISSKKYTGQEIKPLLKITYNGKTLIEGTDYKLYYSNNKNIGLGNITITGIGKYSGSKKITFNIIPNSTKNITLSNAQTSSVSIKWDRVKEAEGYYIYKKEKNSSKYVRTLAVKNSSTASAISTTLKDLKSGTDYTIKVAPYKRVDEKLYEDNSAKEINFTTRLSKVGSISLKSPTKGEGYIVWDPVKNASGYEVKMATSKNGKYITIRNSKESSHTIYSKQNLKSKKTYYFKVRAYKIVNSKKVYGDYSNIKSIKIK